MCCGFFFKTELDGSCYKKSVNGPPAHGSQEATRPPPSLGWNNRKEKRGFGQGLCCKGRVCVRENAVLDFHDGPREPMMGFAERRRSGRRAEAKDWAWQDKTRQGKARQGQARTDELEGVLWLGLALAISSGHLTACQR